MTARWGQITVKEIVSAIGGKQIKGSPDKLIGGLSTDSRKMISGNIFLALKGPVYDGHDFLSDAVRAGASGVIVESGTNGYKQISSNNLAIITVLSTLEALGDLALWWRKKWAEKKFEASISEKIRESITRGSWARRKYELQGCGYQYHIYCD